MREEHGPPAINTQARRKGEEWLTRGSDDPSYEYISRKSYSGGLWVVCMSHIYHTESSLPARPVKQWTKRRTHSQ